jgi:hypothetical protein
MASADLLLVLLVTLRSYSPRESQLSVLMGHLGRGTGDALFCCVISIGYRSSQRRCQTKRKFIVNRVFEMSQILNITSRDFVLPPTVEAHIREKVAALDTYYDRISHCEVAVEAPAVHHHHRGGPYIVREWTEAIHFGADLSLQPILSHNILIQRGEGAGAVVSDRTKEHAGDFGAVPANVR